ncbi:glycosyltransferase family 2 protein [Paenibacillus radicis (ex Xue et al. 2023)]|uniref:Glycosyltransferase family 2 protein n=1 Tax=Paenibacillus radicis (ex Xue et al. 2023) TaxID=2972489 RepID=A0ABT1YUE0_9BACL|nr:glycosyltransferase family A protein [Paenibacillus radicis (ex Xue et al. 2023)]MCR8636074.1 glycosyltransferase family 2 protein [Paenibacillus radicis (ex Xue et al. 2023)]
MKAEVTVVIPSYNPARYLIEALDSVFLQTYKGWKIIIVDDASTDHSLSLVEEYIDNKRVKLVQNEVNMGQSECMNIGLTLTTTPYLIQLDADDWLYPNALEILMAEAENVSEKVGLISGNINVIMENEQGEAVNSFLMKNRSFSDPYDYLQANVSQWPRFYRTSALRAIGGWPTDDPYNGRFMEDKRVLTRLIEKFRFHWIDVPLYYHRRHGANQTHLFEVYQHITEWNIRDALVRWGDVYEPEFGINNDGWIYLANLREK